MAKFYAWSEIRNGGKTKEIDLPSGGKRKVLESRNSVPAGEEVTQAKIGATKEEWENLLANGSVRSYPMPKGTSDTVSPSRAIAEEYMKGGEVQFDKLLEMGLTTVPAMNPPSEEAATLEGV